MLHERISNLLRVGYLQMRDKIAFMNYMTLLGELFNKEISDALKDLYWQALRPYSDKQCESAFEKVITKSKFFPKPVEIIELISYSQSGESLFAWMEVEEAERFATESPFPEPGMLKKALYAD